MDRLPAVPEVVLERALAGRPDTWRGRAGRQPVDVTVITLPPDAAIRRAALAALRPLVADAAGALPRGRAATLCRDGVAFVADACDGGPLPRRLDRDRVRRVGVPAARALAELHGRGLVWGGSAAELLVGRDGAVQLPYDGMVRRRVAGRVGTAAADVTAVLSALADRSDDPRLADLVEQPPADARGLVRAVRRSTRTGPHRSPRRDRPAAVRPGRRRVLIPAGVAAVVAAAALGWWSARPPREARAALPAAVDWTGTVRRLDAARSAALAGHGPLTAADAVGSAADALDTATRAALVRRHLTAVAPEPALVRVTARTVTPQAVTLSVTDTLAGYDYRDAAGRVVGRAAARGERTWTVTLRRTSGGWRFASVS